MVDLEKMIMALLRRDIVDDQNSDSYYDGRWDGYSDVRSTSSVFIFGWANITIDDYSNQMGLHRRDRVFILVMVYWRVLSRPAESQERAAAVEISSSMDTTNP